MTEQFTYSYYKSLLQNFQKTGYRFGNFIENIPTEKTVYLRHDIDVALEYLPNMVDIEQEIGAFSTCFIMVNNDFYNTLSCQNISIIQKCHERGASFGLHVDPNLISDSNSNLPLSPQDVTINFIENLEAVFQFYSRYLQLSPVISWHRPATYIPPYQMHEKIGGFINTYEYRFFKETVYVSDSNRRKFWEESRLSEAITQNRSIQLLTHPFWWREQEQPDEVLFEQMLKIGSDTARRTMTGNIKRYM